MKIIKKIDLRKQDIFGFSKIRFWNRFFFFVFSIVIWLCSLSIFGSVQLEQVLNPTKFSSQNSIIIEVYPESTVNKTNIKAEIILDFLSKQDYVSSYERVSDKELIKIIEQFTLNQSDFSNIPLPILFSVELDSRNHDALSNLQIGLSQRVDNIFFDTEVDLLKRLLTPIYTTQYIVLLIPILAILILIGVLFLIIYAILFSNKEFIRTLILLGTYKSDIYKEAARWIAIRSLQSCIIALVLSTITLSIIYVFDVSSLDIIIRYVKIMLLFLFIIPLLSAFFGAVFVNILVKKDFYSTD